VGSLDPFGLSLWLLRLAFLGCLYLFLLAIGRLLWRDLRAAAATMPGELGRLVVVASMPGGPGVGGSYPLDAVTTLGRDVNNSIAIEDPYVSAEHALLTYRGRTWYVEDRAGTNGTYVNGQPILGILQLGFGDEIQVGNTRFRLERPRPARAP
jgi:hypothetical protein